MPPTSKENEVLVATPEAPASAATAGAFRPEETSSRPSPVALEVPVSVNGARTVEGSDKREPFSETTKTVLVFGNGAVIRLSSPVAAGQLLFLTNEKTKKEVVCQVVKSKNYRNVSGYVELEFTESVVGFWGMRFPTDSRPATAAPATAVPAPPAAKLNPPAPAPVATKAPPPVANAVLKTPEVRPAVPQVAQPNLQSPVPPPVAPKPAVPVAKAPDAPSPTIAASLASSVASLLGSPEVPPAAIAKPGATQPSAQNHVATTRNSEGSTEELKQQATRLQEQLSSMLFGATPSATPASTEKSSTPRAGEPQLDTNPDAHRISKVLELAKPEPLAPPKLATPSKPLPAPVKSSLDTEEVKIPSWLEPLARNAAAPSSTQELIEREKAKHAAELAAREREEVKTEPLPLATETEAPAAAESALEPEAVGIGNLLPLDGESLSQPTQAGSKRGLWIGVAAAAVLAAAGGGWYFLHSAGNPQGPAAAQNVRAAVPAVDGSASAVQPAARTVPESNTTIAQRTTKPTVSEALSNAPAATPPITARPAPVSRDARNSAAAIPAAATERIARSAPPTAAPAKPEPKKPGLGEVHLAAPTVSRAAADDSTAAPTISAGADSAAAGLGSALVGTSASNQPAEPKTPLPIGGDVKPARLLSSTPPMYPALAKTQHISGDVSIDALIDANGKVTTMKVLTGPTLLRQAAMDAVRQWKYQPAALDGKAVPMHLTVTVQFRMQ
jgi:protein TonB